MNTERDIIERPQEPQDGAAEGVHPLATIGGRQTLQTVELLEDLKVDPASVEGQKIISALFTGMCTDIGRQVQRRGFSAGRQPDIGKKDSLLPSPDSLS